MENAESTPDIGPTWIEPLRPAFRSPSFGSLKAFLIKERAEQVVYPKARNIFEAFNSTPFDQVKVVILGQDPYHGPGQAHGLSFSVRSGVPIPPSLQNIFKELHRDLHMAIPTHGDLSKWARQGVLLLNSTLTVRAGMAGSHQGQGWETFTDEVIRSLSQERRGLVFLLWGRHAQAKAALIDQEQHYILRAPHPSPLSAHRGFIGCGHFSKANELILAQGGEAIDWALDPEP